jgi:RNA polymerase sigma factor (TIGR02999 family)
MEQAGEVTVLLQSWGNGDRSVEERLFSLVLPDLRKLAGWLMRRERPDHSLQPTALLNEVYCRLVTSGERDWQNRRHFYAVAGRAMRHLLIDYARARPKAVRVPLEDIEPMARDRDLKLEQAIAIDGLLREIEVTNPDWCSIVELKFFVGFSDQETADALGLPLRTVQRKFGDARRWLFERLESVSCSPKTKTTNS